MQPMLRSRKLQAIANLHIHGSSARAYFTPEEYLEETGRERENTQRRDAEALALTLKQV